MSSKKAATVFSLERYHGQKVTRASAIRLHCLVCCLGQPNEVRLCGAQACPLWGYRTGRSWEQPASFVNPTAATKFFARNPAIGVTRCEPVAFSTGALPRKGVSTHPTKGGPEKVKYSRKNHTSAVRCMQADSYFGQEVTRSSAIRLKCLDCHGNNATGVRRCDFYDCSLWPYRMGGKWEQSHV